MFKGFVLKQLEQGEMKRMACEFTPVRTWVVWILIGLLVVACPPSGFAAPNTGNTVSNLTVTLAWDANLESDLDSYTIHYGLRPGAYFHRTPVGNVTSATIPLPLPRVTYYLAVTAKDIEGLESDFSSEVVFEAPAADIPIETFSARGECVEDQSLTLSFAEGNFNPLSEWTVTAPPAQGRIEARDFEVIYIPNTNAWGLDTFEIVGNIGTPNPGKWVWEVQILPENDPPSAYDQFLSAEGGKSLEFRLEGDDPEGEPLTFEVVGKPALGVLQGQPPNLIYIPPNLDLEGTDTFTYRASDGTLSSPLAVVTIRVSPGSTPPLIHDLELEVREDEFVSFRIAMPDRTDLTIKIIDAPLFGTVLGTPPNLTYRPARDFFGSDSMTLQVSDLAGFSNTAVVYFDVLPVNDIPVVESAQVDTTGSIPVEILLRGEDVDNDDLRYEIVTPPTKGSISGEPPRIVYQPNFGQTGTDLITFRASDGEAVSGTATIQLTLKGQSVAPTLQAQLDPAGNVLLRWTAVPGQRYRVLYRDSLNQTTWLPASEVIVASSVTVRWNGVPQSLDSAVFYAVEALGE